ncbi:MAG: bifunctional riboflavin kinase/FAD synthetase [Bacteroidales bacterium]|nr:bifunctional riboflavin kinase/FAD synthetase [Bacteroidales bacterium]
MRIYNDISGFRGDHPVATIGIFDGVHRGHVKILRRLKELASTYHSETVVITLWPHPRTVLNPGSGRFGLLTTLDEKVELIAAHEMDNLVILPFTKELSNLPFNAFIRDYLVQKVHVKHLVTGYNHHFGKDRKGSYENLKKISRKYGFLTERMGPVIVQENRVSSSGIRHMIEEGRIKTANEALGYKYFINGTVIRGNRMGHQLGFPTANIKPGESGKLIPLNGVYAATTRIHGKLYRGMLNIGIRPTIAMQRHEQTIEVHIFDFEADIYDQPIQVQFHEWMRCERKFSTLEELKEQLETDKKEVLKHFNPN